jgi:hypothetical protein
MRQLEASWLDWPWGYRVCVSDSYVRPNSHCTGRSLPYMLGAASMTSFTIAAFKYTGGLTGYKTDTGEDEVEGREAYKETYRRPVSETIEQVGEGRGESCVQLSGGSRFNRFRHICSRISRAEARAATGQIWRRRWRVPNAQMLNIPHFHWSYTSECKRPDRGEWSLFGVLYILNHALLFTIQLREEAGVK